MKDTEWAGGNNLERQVVEGVPELLLVRLNSKDEKEREERNSRNKDEHV